MDFLLQSNIGSYYANFIFLTVMLIACVVLVFLIGNDGDDDMSYYNKKFALGFFLLGTLFFGFGSYKAFESIKDYNEFSKGKVKVEEYYNIEKVGKTLVFEIKKDNSVLKSHFSSTIEEETDSDYILVAKDQKVSIPKNIVK